MCAPSFKFRRRIVVSNLALGPEKFVIYIVDCEVVMSLHGYTKWSIVFHYTTQYLGVLMSHVRGGEVGQVKCHTPINHVHSFPHLIVPQTRLESLRVRNREALTYVPLHPTTRRARVG